MLQIKKEGIKIVRYPRHPRTDILINHLNCHDNPEIFYTDKSHYIKNIE